jgi:hypothetical protein
MYKPRLLRAQVDVNKASDSHSPKDELSYPSLLAFVSKMKTRVLLVLETTSTNKSEALT